MNSETITLDNAVGAVKQILGSRLGQAGPIEADTRFLDLGLDSLDVAELFLLLEELAGRQLDPASAGELLTIGDLTKLQPAS